jgi:serine/threonine protein kinase
MICCLNPGCKLENPPCPDAMQYCSSCGAKLVLLSDRYCPVRRIGEGGFGVTYLAQDRERFNKDCVIKQLIVHSAKAKELFEQEAKQLEHLGSQCSQIPSLLAYPSDKQYLYLVQEFIAGQNLEKYLADKGVQNEEQIKDFLNALLPVLELIHNNNIIHRDIKLDNIMRRDNGQLVLIDFGVAKQFVDNNTPIPGTIAGTPGYAPFEQMIKGIAYPSSDLYSLGAACFHLLTGKNPYEAYEVHDFSWTSKWRQYLPQPISPGLGKIIDKMLQEKYQNRYQSAGEVIKALQDLKPPNLVPHKKVSVNPSVHLTHKTAWLNFYTALIGGVVALIGGTFTIINLQAKNPVVSTFPTNVTTSSVTTLPSNNSNQSRNAKSPQVSISSTVNIYANKGWSKTDICPAREETIEISASGRWSNGHYRSSNDQPWQRQYYDPDGFGQSGDPGNGLPFPDANVGALIGRIEDNPIFLVGNHLSYQVKNKGCLFFSINDSDSSLGDNIGFVSVKVKYLRK